MTYPTGTTSATPTASPTSTYVYPGPTESDGHPRECSDASYSNPNFPPCDCVGAGSKGVICSSSDTPSSTPPATTPAPRTTPPASTPPPVTRTSEPVTHRPTPAASHSGVLVPTSPGPSTPQLASTGAPVWTGLVLALVLMVVGLGMVTGKWLGRR